MILQRLAASPGPGGTMSPASRGGELDCYDESRSRPELQAGDEQGGGAEHAVEGQEGEVAGGGGDAFEKGRRGAAEPGAGDRGGGAACLDREAADRQVETRGRRRGGGWAGRLCHVG